MADLHFKALLVGNGTFPKDPSNLHELKGPQNDLRALEDALTHPQVGLFQKGDVQVLLDCTKEEIMEAANDFFDSAKRNDQLLLYYSGHGLLDKFNNFYFCTRSTRIDALIPTAISDQVLNSMIRQAISPRVVIIIDCCHSGRFKAAAMPENLKGEGRFVIASSRAKELAKDAAKVDQPSPFTKFLVEALLSSEVDTNKDGYISINELYDYVLPRIHEKTKQRPIRIFDKAIAEVALAKSNADAPTPVVEKERNKRTPVLSVSTTSLIIDDVEVGEALPDEIIDVFDEGGGKLDWTYECKDDWIEIEKFKGHIKLKFQTKPGMNRGRVYIRDLKTGQSKRIQIRVKVRESVRPPKLQLANKTVNLGSVSRGAKAPSRDLRLVNLGDGDLEARATPRDDWVEAELYGDILQISASTKNEGIFSSSVRVDSAGGSVSIPIKVVIESGPVLKVSPITIDFKTVQQGAKNVEKLLTVKNGGKGELEWDFKGKGSYFSAERHGNCIHVVLDTSEIVKFQGSIFITSNGGEKTVPVKVRIKEAAHPEEKPAKGDFVDISGAWQYSEGIGNFTGPGPTYQYQSTNFMGVTVEQGTAHVVGNKVTIQAYNVLIGAFSMRLQVLGNTMSGTVTAPMGTVPITLQKSGNVPIFNAIANLFNW